MPSPQAVETFCCAYLASGNATQAYIQAVPRAAAWKRRSAGRKAVDLMKRPDVLARIEALTRIMRERRDADFVAQLEEDFARARRERLEHLDGHFRGSSRA